MSTTMKERHDQLADRVAASYRNRGYRVTVEPTIRQLPDFLSSFRPDLIAENEDESLVIEVKLPGSAPSGPGWDQLALEIGKHPGWKFEIVSDDPNEPVPAASLSLDEIA